MPTVRFASAFQRHLACPPQDVGGTSVREALEAYFVVQPQARDYVLDELGTLRRHVMVFVDGTAVRSRDLLDDAVAPNAIVDVFQALSGG